MAADDGDDVQRVPYDEFGLFHENAAEFGLAYDGPPVVRRQRVEVSPGRALSALVWGSAPPELVLLHGGAQNAHTWDTVALALDRPLVAIDLPGHGHSDGPADEGTLDLGRNAADVAEVVRALAPSAAGIVGMSLGGLTTLALAGQTPELVRAAVLVDVLPSVSAAGAAPIVAFVDGPPSFDSFDDLLARTIQFNPTRSESSLRRGILHNAVQRDDGSWVWRHARFPHLRAVAEGELRVPPDFGRLWDVVGGLTVPLMLVRGMRPGSVIDDDGEAELRRRAPGARVEHVDAGHSVQGDQPVELARLIDDFLPAR
jgi:pimeloyl-ACP methyl ester carboxylesterase